MIRYKIDIMQTLADAGYARQRLRDSGIISQATILNIKDLWRLQTMSEEQIQANPRLAKRAEEGISDISLGTLSKICIMCGLKIEDVVEVVATDEEILECYNAKIRRA